MSKQNELYLSRLDTAKDLGSAQHGFEHLVSGLWDLQQIEAFCVPVAEIENNVRERRYAQSVCSAGQRIRVELRG